MRGYITTTKATGANLQVARRQRHRRLPFVVDDLHVRAVPQQLQYQLIPGPRDGVKYGRFAVVARAGGELVHPRAALYQLLHVLQGAFPRRQVQRRLPRRRRAGRDSGSGSGRGGIRCISRAADFWARGVRTCLVRPCAGPARRHTKPACRGSGRCPAARRCRAAPAETGRQGLR